MLPVCVDLKLTVVNFYQINSFEQLLSSRLWAHSEDKKQKKQKKQKKTLTIILCNNAFKKFPAKQGLISNKRLEHTVFASTHQSFWQYLGDEIAEATTESWGWEDAIQTSFGEEAI